MAENDNEDRWPSAAERDLEARQDKDYKPGSALSTGRGEVSETNAPYAVEGNDTSAYVGVSPEYMTYANDTEKPLKAESGPQAELEKQLTSGFAVGKVADVKSKQTLGGGSLHETVYPATSGEDFTSEQTDGAKDAPRPQPVKKAAASQPGTPSNQ